MFQVAATIVFIGAIALFFCKPGVPERDRLALAALRSADKGAQVDA
jgi:hypothetical protein